MPSLSNTLLVLFLAPGLMLAWLQLRKKLAHPMNVLLFWVLGFWLAGKGGVLFEHRGSIHSLSDLATDLVNPVRPLAFHAAAIGASVFTAVQFAIFGRR